MVMGSRTGRDRKVGELAQAAGLTVRTLHYYEEIGLLVASARSRSGHRLYSDQDVERLYRICLLRRLGLPLDQISRALDDPAWSLSSTLRAHLAALEDRLEATTRLRGHLARLIGLTGPGMAPTDELLTVLEEMTMLDTIAQRRISILVYSDLEAAFDYLVDVFGLGPGHLVRSEAGDVVHGELQVGDGVVWLHRESSPFRLSSPGSVGAATAMVAVMVDDVDAHFRHTSARGASIEYEPVDQPYGYREYGARDSEGGLWAFMKSLG